MFDYLIIFQIHLILDFNDDYSFPVFLNIPYKSIVSSSWLQSDNWVTKRFFRVICKYNIIFYKITSKLFIKNSILNNFFKLLNELHLFNLYVLLNLTAVKSGYMNKIIVNYDKKVFKFRHLFVNGIIKKLLFYYFFFTFFNIKMSS